MAVIFTIKINEIIVINDYTGMSLSERRALILQPTVLPCSPRFPPIQHQKNSYEM